MVTASSPVLRVRAWVLAANLVLSPWFVLVCWLTGPGCDKVQSEEIDGWHAAAAQSAVIWIFAGALLSLPATLALMQVLRDRSPRVARVAGSLTLVSWVAVIALSTSDLLAVDLVKLGGPSPLFATLLGNLGSITLIVGLDVLATLHVVGGVMLGWALIRARVIPRVIAVMATLAPPIRFVVKLDGSLSVNALTWLVLATAGTLVTRALVTNRRRYGPARGTTSRGNTTLDATQLSRPASAQMSLV